VAAGRASGCIVNKEVHSKTEGTTWALYCASGVSDPTYRAKWILRLTTYYLQFTIYGQLPTANRPSATAVKV
jgi:hypothetical protein